MNLQATLRPGMRLIGPDNHDYGAVERYDDESVYANGRRIPFGAIERLDHDRLYLDTAGVYSLIENDSAGIGTDGQVRIPVTEERLEVGKRQIDLGEIRVHKTVEEVEEVRRGPLNREEVEIERVKVNRRVTVPEERRQEGDWLVIPVMEEIFVVEKRLVVTEEIRIRKHLVTEDREVRESVRREHASIDDTRARAPTTPTSNTDAGGDDAAWDELHAEIRGAHC
jgi:uncharacterized protein (TIGR02271 family)